MRIGVNLGPVHVSGSTARRGSENDLAFGILGLAIFAVIGGVLWLIDKISHLFAWAWSLPVGHWVLVISVSVILGTLGHFTFWVLGYAVADVRASRRLDREIGGRPEAIYAASYLGDPAIRAQVNPRHLRLAKENLIAYRFTSVSAYNDWLVKSRTVKREIIG